MALINCSLPRLLTIVALAATFQVPGAGATTHSDWDIHMLNLVNRARTDPALENAIQGTSYSHSPVSPVAYNLLLDDATFGHNNWMFENLGNEELLRTDPPRSFAHNQTDNGQSTGTPLINSPGYTGATVGQRITNAGLTWNAAGENLAAAWSSTSIPVNAARVESNHTGWWNSTGHRNNMMNVNFRLFGHAIETRLISPTPENNLPSWTTRVHLATQKFARASSGPTGHIFGLVYEDLDSSGAWTPRDNGHSMREGIAGLPFELRRASDHVIIADGLTMESGAFTIPVSNGEYHLVFTDASLPAGILIAPWLTVAGGWNTDTGALEILAMAPLAGDVNLDGVVDHADLAVLQANLGAENAWWMSGDLIGDERVGLRDAFRLFDNFGASGPTSVTIPEPGTLIGFALGVLAILPRRRA